MKLRSLIYSVALAGALVSLTTSCDDMLDKGNDFVWYPDEGNLSMPADSVTFVAGIFNKLQAIAVRTNLLGEVRGDLVVVNSNATTDLKDLANFEADEDNMYNVPRDYYAVINNCNYFLANADSTAGNAARGEKYFVYEIAQVHSIRAWVYLQLVLAYGKVPLVTEPILDRKSSLEQYPMTDLTGICEYFINDLQPYYGVQYPEWTTIGGDIDPKFCFFPSQIVMGDMNLWMAVKTGDATYAKTAAKNYYDYIVWDLNGKSELVTTAGCYYWDMDNLIAGSSMLRSVQDNVGNLSDVWGNTNADYITKIPMDSAAADGYYNELRNLYNTTYVTELSQASISPSDYLINLSESQKYVTYNAQNDTTIVTSDRLTEELVESHAVGDLRFQKFYSSIDVTKLADQFGVDLDTDNGQSIGKHNSQHISIYRTPQLYLRLAEALNYAGYPRFAKQILVMGLSDNVIANEVTPYYNSVEDSTFISYFQFNTNTYLPYAVSYSTRTNDYGIVTARTPSARSSYYSECNMWGVHSRGSGLAFLDAEYGAYEAPDSTSYPFAELAAIPATPEEVPQPSSESMLSYDDWALTKRNPSESAYETYCTNYADTMAAWQQYQEEMVSYQASIDVYVEAYNEWYKNAYTSTTALTAKEQKIMDDLILKEQALEMSYEGNRFYDLMRRAYWWKDKTYLTGMEGKEGASKLASESNWFLKWNGEIGLYDDEDVTNE